MAQLTTKEQEYLLLGLYAENKGVQLHKYPAAETHQIIYEYILTKDSKYIDTLIELAKIWRIYFEEGEAAAKAYTDQKRKELLLSITIERELNKALAKIM